MNRLFLTTLAPAGGTLTYEQFRLLIFAAWAASVVLLALLLRLNA